MNNDSAGKIITGETIQQVAAARLFLTVRGAINPSELGVTLTHEHLFVRFEEALQPTRYLKGDVANLKFTIENLGVIRHYP